MGCFFSRSNRVAPEPESEATDAEQTEEATVEEDKEEKTVSVENKDNANLEADGEPSKEQTDEENPGYIITEYSYQFQVDKVVNNFEENEDLDLTIIGKACLTWKECERRRKKREEQKIIESLRREGLISCPQIQTGGGIRYDIVETAASFTDGRVRYPPRLAALELGRENRKIQTQEDIKKKLEDAEKRRKEREGEFVDKMKRETRDKLDSGAERVTERLKKQEELHAKKMEAAEEKRERKKADARERMKEREEYRQRVKIMKDINLDDLDPT